MLRRRAERATLSKPVSFCGFEMQQNSSEQGGGNWISSSLCLRKRLNLSSLRIWIWCAVPELALEPLLWLATPTKPELSVGVTAMSKLCTKAPEITINLGLKMMSYLRRPSQGMIYADHPGPSHGARGQLSKPRCVRTIEAFSDISYASTKGYRSLHRAKSTTTLELL